MRRMILLLGIILLPATPIVHAQEIYRTTEGDLFIKLSWNNQPLIVKSNNVQFFLNYETAAFRCFVDIGTLQTNNDSLNEILIRKKGIKAIFTGKMGLPEVNTKKNGIERFGVEGKLDVIGKQSLLTGTGILEHLYEGTNYSAMLNLTFSLRFTQITIPAPLPDLFDEFHIELIQAILRKEQ